MLPTSTAARATERWARRSAQSGGDYSEGVRTTTRSWATAAAAGAANWRAGVSDAGAQERFTRNVRAAGDQRWRDRSERVGAGRFTEGVGAAQAEYSQAIAPVLETVGRLDLPPRGPAGSPGNYQRSQKVGEALRALRLGGKK